MFLPKTLAESIVSISERYLERKFEWSSFNCVHFVIEVYGQVSIELPVIERYSFPPRDFHLSETEFESMPIAPLLIYIMTPIIVFSGAVSAVLDVKTFSLPLLFFVPASLMCLLFYYIAGKVWKGTERNILAYAAGTGNTGYFGLPLILAFYDPAYFNIAVFIGLGGILYESAIGFFIVARGNFSWRSSVSKVLKLPTVYALILGVIINLSHVEISKSIFESLSYFKGTYIVLGMMLTGISLSQVTREHMDTKFSVFAFVSKFVVFPLLGL